MGEEEEVVEEEVVDVEGVEDGGVVASILVLLPRRAESEIPRRRGAANAALGLRESREDLATAAQREGRRLATGAEEEAASIVDDSLLVFFLSF